MYLVIKIKKPLHEKYFAVQNAPKKYLFKRFNGAKTMYKLTPTIRKNLFIVGNGRIGTPAMKEIGAQTIIIIIIIIIKARK